MNIKRLATHLALAAWMLSTALCALPVCAATTITVQDVQTPRSTIRIARYRPDAPLANLIMLPGGIGVLGLQSNGQGNDFFQINTLSRNRDAFVAAGYSVILVDAAANTLPGGLQDDYRLSPEHMAELRAVLRAVRDRDDLPTWVVGNSKGGVSASAFAVTEPNTSPFGLILVSPYYQPIFSLNLESLKRPTLLVTHAADTCVPPAIDGPLLMSRLTSAVAKQYVEYTVAVGPPDCDPTGPHGLAGLDAQFVADVVSWMVPNEYFVQAANYQGLWWQPSESGWGVNVTQQGDILFATWFTYDTDGSGLWLVMPRGERTGDGAYSGTLYRTTGPSFSTARFDPAQVKITQVGSATFTFADSNNGTFTYTVNGINQSKAIVRQVYRSPVPACVAGGVQGASPNYQALWWGGENESGWGVNVTHQGDILFATWFTYDASSKGQWLVMSSGAKTAPGTYTGVLYRTTGPAFNATPWDPNRVVLGQPVGTATFTFADAGNGTFAYTLDAVSQTKSITRQIYSSPQTVCR